MFASVPLWLAIATFFIGSSLGLLIMCLMNASSDGERCTGCSYVRFYQKFLRRLVDSKGEKIENVAWFSDELKRPYVKRAV